MPYTYEASSTCWKRPNRCRPSVVKQLPRVIVQRMVCMRQCYFRLVLELIAWRRNDLLPHNDWIECKTFDVEFKIPGCTLRFLRASRAMLLCTHMDTCCNCTHAYESPTIAPMHICTGSSPCNKTPDVRVPTCRVATHVCSRRQRVRIRKVCACRESNPGHKHGRLV